MIEFGVVYTHGLIVGATTVHRGNIIFALKPVGAISYFCNLAGMTTLPAAIDITIYIQVVVIAVGSGVIEAKSMTGTPVILHSFIAYELRMISCGPVL